VKTSNLIKLLWFAKEHRELDKQRGLSFSGGDYTQYSLLLHDAEYFRDRHWNALSKVPEVYKLQANRQGKSTNPKEVMSRNV
jgi:hypothetical protein